MDNKIFGDVAAKIQVVEFQKRGLPHAHILVILHKNWKIRSPDQFDKYVYAELPNSDTSYLRSLVIQHMMHGPCGSHNPNCACMEERGKTRVCRFGFPKAFSEVTTTNEDSYPAYRRRNNGDKVHIRGLDMDNRWVIPYNPYLLATFDCHINVEICSTIKAVKYLYKYVYKGHDRVSFKVTSSSNDIKHDEIESYQSARWISPPEAAWRLFAFDLYSMTPSVVPLSVHTHDMQSIQFSTDEDLEDVLADKQRKTTMLLEFFKKNSEMTNGKKLLYHEFPEHFTWNEGNRKWAKRSRGTAIGRLTYASPMEGDRYYLRLLLANIRAPTSFKDLLTVNGKLCSTFQEAALEHKLLEGDNVVESCMNEGAAIEMPHVLRKLFATLLVFCEPTNPKKLWHQFYEDLSEDFRYRAEGNLSLILNQTVKAVQQYLENMGKSLADYNLSDVLEACSDVMNPTRDITDALNAPIPSELINARKKLNTAQRAAYKEIITHVKNNKGGAFFIDGPGGTGKTFLYCALYARVRQLGKIVLPTAASGIAAANLPTGRTTHSRFKIPVDHGNGLSCKVGKQSSLASLLRQTSLIIWDEASMSHRHNIEALNLLLQDLCDSQELFGGKIVVFGGDFRQVLPVLQHKTQAEAVDASLVSSEIWPHLKKFKLTENMRAKEDPDFSTFLLQLGNGKLQRDTYGSVPLPHFLTPSLKDAEHTLEHITSELLPESTISVVDPLRFTTKAILAPRNEEVDMINEQIIAKFPGQSVTYKSFDKVADDEASNYPPEFLHTLCPGGMPPYELTLKPNCPAMLLRNIDPSSGLCNGTRLICKQFHPNLIQCEIACGQHKGETVLLPRIIMKPSESSNFPLQLERKQFPIKLSFAMTINKAQGQTLEQVGVYLKEPCFSHGQLYVALSRARKSKQLTIFTNHATEEAMNTHTLRNVVAFEVLIRAGILHTR